MSLSRRGVYANASESKYSFSIGGFEYFFSSRIYKDKFIKRIAGSRVTTIKRMCDLGFDGDVTTFADLRLYRKIETRGFKVVHNNEVLTWQEASKYALRKMIG